MGTLEHGLLYEFGGFRLEPRQRVLLDAEGRRAPISPRAFEALCLLVARRGELVEKATLMAALWPDVIVDDNSLTQCISALRRALAERPGASRFIATVPGRGYQFVALVETREAAQASGPAPAASVERVAATERNVPHASVAVLPFANLSGDPARNYIADGIAEELIHTLAHLPDFKVPARTSSFAYRDRQIDVRQIASELNVAAVLEGSIRVADDRLRVTVQLIDGTTGYHLWSSTYDRGMTGLLELQEEIAAAAARALMHSPTYAPRAWPAHPTQDPIAYELFLQGQSFFTRPNPQNLARSTELFTQAIGRDPQFARAYLGLAHSQHLSVVFQVGAHDCLARCEENARQALRLDPHLAQGHAVLGAVNAHRAKWADAARHFHDALRMDSRDPQIVLPYVMNLLITPGYLRRALETLREAYVFSPSLAGMPSSLAMVAMLLGLDAEARRYAELATTLGWSRSLGPLSDTLSRLYVRAGEFDEAASVIAQDLTRGVAAADGASTVRLVFEALGNRDRRAAAVAALLALEQRVTPDALDRPMRQRLILWNTELGALDAAFESATRTLDYFETIGTVGTVWGALWLPEMAPFRADSRFAVFARRLGLPSHWALNGRPDSA